MRTRKGKMAKYNVGQYVIQEERGKITIHRIGAIDPDGTLYEDAGAYVTKISADKIRPLTKREAGSE